MVLPTYVPMCVPIYVCMYVLMSFIARHPRAFQIQEQGGKGVTRSADGLGLTYKHSITLTKKLPIVTV